MVIPSKAVSMLISYEAVGMFISYEAVGLTYHQGWKPLFISTRNGSTDQAARADAGSQLT